MTVDAPDQQATARTLDVQRLVAAVVLVASIVALAVMAWASNRSVRSITELRPAVGASASESTPVASPTLDTGTLTALPTLGPNPLPSSRPAVLAPADPVSPDGDGGPDPVVPPAPASSPTRIYADCPALGLPAPEKVGGVASIVPLVPLFGPFSAEAFGFLPALQPGIEFFGPAMPELERALGELAPVLAALTPGASALGNAGFEVLAPLYGPVRPQFLDAEADLANSLQPLVRSVAEAPGSECAIAAEAVLVSVLANRPDLGT